jgi:hypothetical protein
MNRWQHAMASSVLAASIACASVPMTAEKEATYDSCVHEALKSEGEAFQCVDDGQNVGWSFAGHVVTQDDRGRLRALREVRFWRAYVSPSGEASPGEELKVNVGADGWFSIPQPVGYVNALEKKNGRFVATDQLNDILFTLRAPGCQDYEVHFRPDDPERVIIMSCSGQSAAAIGTTK